MLATRKRNLADASGKPPAVSAKREDILKLTLDDYLEWVGPLREGFIWASTYLADLHIFDVRSIPYPKQLVPLAAIRVVLGPEADLYGVRERITQWFWCGVLGELYGSAIETRFVRDLEQVPDWATDRSSVTPRTVQDASFVESRLHSLRTRNAAAYKGIYALILGEGARDWLFNQALDRIPYQELAVDIHHIFPQKWCLDNGIDDERRESIVNKTPLAAKTNRIIGGVAPVRYLAAIEKRAQIGSSALDRSCEHTSSTRTLCDRPISTLTSPAGERHWSAWWKRPRARSFSAMSSLGILKKLPTTSTPPTLPWCRTRSRSTALLSRERVPFRLGALGWGNLGSNQ